MVHDQDEVMAELERDFDRLETSKLKEAAKFDHYIFTLSIGAIGAMVSFAASGNGSVLKQNTFFGAGFIFLVLTLVFYGLNLLVSVTAHQNHSKLLIDGSKFRQKQCAKDKNEISKEEFDSFLNQHAKTLGPDAIKRFDRFNDCVVGLNVFCFVLVIFALIFLAVAFWTVL